MKYTLLNCHLIWIAIGFLQTIYGADPFQRSLVRFNCYGDTKPAGCNQSLTSAYPNLSLSVDNSTRAETYFVLYTQQNREVPELLHECGGRLPPNSKFNANNPTEIFIPGYLFDTCSSPLYKEFKYELLKRGDYNVILVDAAWGNKGDYNLAIRNGKIVAQQLGTLLGNIMQQTGVSSKNFHIIGHSLGAQIAGFTGQFMRENFSPIRRITALDPAGPGFRKNMPEDERLDKSDADLVDVIHTNAGPCLPFAGADYNLGHADFYVNGGTFQLSCIPFIPVALIKLDFLYVLESFVFTLCSHLQAQQYYKASINPGDCQFVAIHCENYAEFKAGRCRKCQSDGSNCLVMGHDFEKYYDESVHGVEKAYYLDTKLTCPYCDNSKLDLEGSPYADTKKQSVFPRRRIFRRQ